MSDEVQRYIRRSDVAAPPRRPACLYQFPEVRRPSWTWDEGQERRCRRGVGTHSGLGWGYYSYFLSPVPGGGNIYVAGASAFLVPLVFDLMVITSTYSAEDASFVLDPSYPLCSQS